MRSPSVGRRRRPAILPGTAVNLRPTTGSLPPAGATAPGPRGRRPERPDVVMLDLGLPDMDGIDVIRGIRGWSTVPIIVLSADGRSAQGRGSRRRRRRLRDQAVRHGRAARPAAGSDPPGRARPTTSRWSPPPTSPSTWPPSGSTPGRPDVRLTPTEWQLLEVLVRNRGRLVSQRQLLQEVWGPPYGSETNYLRVYIAQLRRKLEPDPAGPATCSPSRAWATASRPSSDPVHDQRSRPHRPDPRHRAQ